MPLWIGWRSIPVVDHLRCILVEKGDQIAQSLEPHIAAYASLQKDDRCSQGQTGHCNMQPARDDQFCRLVAVEHFSREFHAKTVTPDIQSVSRGATDGTSLVQLVKCAKYKIVCPPHLFPRDSR